MAHTYYFLLGAAQALAFEELSAVVAARFPKSQLQFDAPPFACVISQGQLPIESLQNLLGGCVKIGQEVTVKNNEAALAIALDLAKTAQRRFTISSIKSNVSLESVAKKIKTAASEHDHVVSYRLGKSAYESVSLASTVEYCLFQDKVIKIAATQDIASWNKRDYSRPRIDPKSGMLPPKIARMLVNVAIPEPEKKVLYDPFCGSGTILAEALLLGHKVFGSDISNRAVEDTIDNLAWLSQIYAIDLPYEITAQDVHHAQLPKNALVDAIVFEGYLGPAHIKQSQIANQLKGMSKLYLGALKRLRTLVKPGGIIVAALPAYVGDNGLKTLDNLIDRIARLGYTPVLPILEYGRPSAITKRRIYRFKKE